ncbi:MAG: transcriptional regulator [Cellvibrionales bacterium]|nr:transcriptional regulator [Cellvibrionales bacterium]
MNNLIRAAKTSTGQRQGASLFLPPQTWRASRTPTRWTIVEALTGNEPLGVRELARRTARDVKGVHTDANALVTAGIIDRTADGKYSFPFNKVKVRFELHAAA